MKFNYQKFSIFLHNDYKFGKTIKCEICDRPFKTRSGLINHMINYHDMNDNYIKENFGES